tara:strand:+ start:555 stop:740 length:186 start_codon:yes stop_codon:yes gene_type:complete
MFKSFYIKKKEDVKNKTSKYLKSIDAIFADTKIVDHVELEDEIISNSVIVENIQKKWWKCC